MVLRELIFRNLEMRVRVISCLTTFLQQTPMCCEKYNLSSITTPRTDTTLVSDMRRVSSPRLSRCYCTRFSMCDKSRNTWLCVHWQWNTLGWCQLNALQASPVVYLVTPLSCVSLSMNTQPSVPTLEIDSVLKSLPITFESSFIMDRPEVRQYINI